VLNGKKMIDKALRDAQHALKRRMKI